MCCILNDGDFIIYYFVVYKYYFNEYNRKIKVGMLEVLKNGMV